MTSIGSSTSHSHGLEALSHRSETASVKSKHFNETGESKTPPAQAARALIETRSDLSSVPFGSIVSLLARHQEPPAAPEAPVVPVETPDSSDVIADTDTPTV
jgi:hypothetical protein